MYPREYLYFGCHNQPLAEQLIQSLHLTEHLSKPIAQLSKGYRQRLAIAKTLLSDAPLILLDEPTNGIDRLQLNDLYSLLDQLCHDRTIIISSHHIEELQLFCPRSIQLSETPSLTAPHL
jgi:ABC-2 type transport system ATP-binding protein